MPTNKSTYSLSPRYRVSRYFSKVINTISPPVCENCQKGANSPLCTACQQQINLIDDHICDLCGNYCETPHAICAYCKHEAPKTTQIRAVAWYDGPIQKSVHALKYKKRFGLAQPLSEIMVDHWHKYQREVDVIIPVPLHERRLEERSYNQAELLAKDLARAINVPLEKSGLFRVKSTNRQVDLNRDQRKTNMQAAFVAVPEKVAGKRILLIDDVCTTGATLNSSAEALLNQGAADVFAYCLARARSLHQHKFGY